MLISFKFSDGSRCNSTVKCNITLGEFHKDACELKLCKFSEAYEHLSAFVQQIDVDPYAKFING